MGAGPNGRARWRKESLSAILERFPSGRLSLSRNRRGVERAKAWWGSSIFFSKILACGARAIRGIFFWRRGVDAQQLDNSKSWLQFGVAEALAEALAEVLAEVFGGEGEEEGE